MAELEVHSAALGRDAWETLDEPLNHDRDIVTDYRLTYPDDALFSDVLVAVLSHHRTVIDKLMRERGVR